MAKIRLDQLVFDLGLTESKERAKTTIMAGSVFVNGQRADKPGMQVSPDVQVEVKGNPLPFVSRGGWKLDKALKVFPIHPEGLICMDCGASTGGFTDVLLQHGAAKVYSVDVGYGQLAWKLRNDERVVNLERTNLRYADKTLIPDPIKLAVMDVSFISIKLILPAIVPLLEEEAEVMCLIKPQFEAGREQVGKKGVVRDSAVHEAVVNDILMFVPGIGLQLAGLDFSPIRGPEGNIEYLCYLRKTAEKLSYVPDVADIVRQSHEALKG